MTSRFRQMPATPGEVVDEEHKDDRDRSLLQALGIEDSFLFGNSSNVSLSLYHDCEGSDFELGVLDDNIDGWNALRDDNRQPFTTFLSPTTNTNKLTMLEKKCREQEKLPSSKDEIILNMKNESISERRKKFEIYITCACIYFYNQRIIYQDIGRLRRGTEEPESDEHVVQCFAYSEASATTRN
jgi:hypothetical protein